MWQLMTMLANEIGLAVLAFTVLTVSLLAPPRVANRATAWITLLGILGLLAGSAWAGTASVTGFGGAYQVGPVAIWFKRLFLMAGGLVTLLVWPANRRDGVGTDGLMGEGLALMLFSLTGMGLLVSARELIFLYVGLELVTLPLILLVAFHPSERRSAEAGLKYVLFSALSSGFLLYGLSLVYGLTGTTLLALAPVRLPVGPLTWVALVLVLGGVGFKIAAVPFHLWAPDTYEGAPTPVAAFLSVASKAAGFVLFYQVVATVFQPLQIEVGGMTAVLATATMTWGNLAALHQTNLKRFLAYSSIAQAGYLMMGLVHPGALGLTSVLFYLWVYLFSNLAAFGVVTGIAAATGKEDVRDYVGLSLTNPILALVMMLAMFSLAGIPPLAGFFGKFYLFAAVAERGWYWLVIVGAANATISLYYYLVVIKWMYLLPPTEAQPALPGLTLPVPLRWVLGLTAAGMVLVGLVPQVIYWTEQAAATGF